MSVSRGKVPPNVVGLRLCKMFGEDLWMTEPVMFVKGAAAVDIVLRRAALSGRVEIGEDMELGDYWADLLEKDGSLESHAALDAKSFRAIKNHWARCRYEKSA